MGADQHQSWRQTAISALDWWRDAGVDTLVEDTTYDWLGRSVMAPLPGGPARGPVAVPTPVAAPLPKTLEEFIAWRAGGDAPEADWGSAMFVASGSPASDLMVAIDCADADGLLTGPAGALFDRMLAAIGRDRTTTYLAPLAVARPIGGRLRPTEVNRAAELFRHHLSLALPKRLLIIGQAASRALIGMDTARGRRSLHAINLDGGSVEAVTSWTPQFLLDRPEYKAGAWEDLQLLTGGLR